MQISPYGSESDWAWAQCIDAISLQHKFCAPLESSNSASLSPIAAVGLPLAE